MRCGLTLSLLRLTYTVYVLIDKADRKLFWQATQPGHSLHLFSVLKPLLTVLTSFVRGHIHISFPLFNIAVLKLLHQSSFI